ncbi:MAG: hypothetical protein ABIR19_03525, partial [Ginsengibacter sp.]
MKKLTLFILLGAFIIKAAHSQSILPDPSFGTKGVVKTDFNLSKLGSMGRQILLQPDGSFFEVVESVDGLTVLAKISPDGQRDITYGTQGYSSPLDITQAVAAIQPDGKVVIAGSAEVRSHYTGPTGETDLKIARFNTDGSLDNSFNGDGILEKSIRSTDEAKKIIVRNDGKIIVFSMGDSHWFSVSAFLPDGSADNTFDGINYPIEGYTGAVLQDNNKIVLTDYSFSLSAAYTIRLNTNGTVDNSFVTTTLNGVGVQTLHLQPDGKILLGAYTENGAPSFFLERFMPNGSVDASFGNMGIVVTDFSGGGSIPLSIVPQNDGKILVSGYTITSGDFPLSVARYNSDGSLDNTFSGDGLAIISLGNGAYTEFLTALQNDNKFLVAYTDNNHFAVSRFNVNGSFDRTFNQRGSLNEGIIMGSTFFLASALQSDGKLVTAGYTYNGNNFDIALSRYNINGTLDLTFSGDGKQVTDIKSADDKGYAVVIQNNGKIIVAGSSISRYNPDGTLDKSYGKNGIIASADWKSAVIQADGKLVVAGSSISRFNTDGTIDNSFGNNGVIAGGNWYAVAVQANGKIVVAGGINNFEIARYNSNGTPDNSFSNDGFESTHIYEDPNADDIYYAGHARAVAIQADGKIVTAGDWHYSYRNTTSYFALVRYNTDGTLDNSFGQDGTLRSIYGYATSLVLQPDGKIIAGG